MTLEMTLTSGWQRFQRCPLCVGQARRRQRLMANEVSVETVRNKRRSPGFLLRR